jgi:hypothetical protein
MASNTGILLSGDGRVLKGPETGIHFGNREVRRIVRIEVKGRDYLLAATNNDDLLWYRIVKDLN